jgi:subtilisin-like proprotein convertase family protein/subtilisin family serine protease
MDGLRRGVAALVVASGIVLAGVSSSEAGSATPDASPHLYVVSDAPEQVSALAASSARVIARYETFTLVEASGADAEALAIAGADQRDDMRTITVDGKTFDPTVDGAPLIEKGSAPATAGLAVVQFVGPIRDAWLKTLGATGVRVISYMAQNAYLVSGSAQQLREVGELIGVDPAVRAAVRYTAADKIASGVDDSGSQRIAVQTLSGDDGAGPRNQLAEAGTELTDRSAVGPYRTQFMRVDAAEARDLAHDPGVIAVQPDPPPKLLDERQAQIVAGNLTGVAPAPLIPTGPGYLALYNTLGLGSGSLPFTIDLTDSGIDVGTPATANADFHEEGVGANPSRIGYVHNFTTDGSGEDCSGHGTLNAGIIAGFNTGTGASVEDASGYNYDLGIAPRAIIGNSKVFRCDGDFSLSSSITALAGSAYASGARISNNSWGTSVGGAYDSRAQEFDSLVRDASPGVSGNQQMVEVVSAGNSGSGVNTIGSPGTAKNVITVGASEGVRPIGMSDGCGVTDAVANSARDIVDFSSRGPTDDGRTKPDLVAPGTHIAGSQPLTAGDYNGSGTCNPQFPAGSTVYSLGSGTSQAAPAVSAIAALIRQAYVLGPGSGTPPSPAMTKAILANSATDEVGGAGNAGNVPNQDQGWGLASIPGALAASSRSFFDQGDIFGATGGATTRSFTIADPSKPVLVTLAWTDAVGPTTGNSFVNDLNLSLAHGSGAFKGNVFSGGVSATGGTADPRDNLESVYLPAGSSGHFTVTVTAANIAGDGVPGNADTTDQDYALVVSNATAAAPAPVLAAQSTALTPSSPGDGDNDVEPGERFRISETLQNIGIAGATGVTGTLTGPAAVKVVDASAGWPDIGVGATAPNSDDLVMQVRPSATCGAPISLTLTVANAQGGSSAVPVNLQTGGLGSPVNRSSADIPKAIPDNNAAGVTSSLAVTPSGLIRDVDVTIGQITHTFDGDLLIQLTSPAGTTVTLANRVGGSGDNFTNTVFDDEAATSITSGAAPFTGQFRPAADQLSRFDGQDQVGVWTLKVSDLAGNDTGTLSAWGTKVSPLVCDFVADTNPPETTIDSGPADGATVTTATAAFGFSSSEADSTFECQIDGGAFADCTTPLTTPTLANGAHSFAVRAIDPSTNEDPTPATRGFTVAVSTAGSSAPDTTLTKSPRKKSKKKKATFEFTSNQAGATFQCSLDDAKFAACTSPEKVKHLKVGKHSFEVRAVSAAGTDPSPAKASWKVKRKHHGRHGHHHG